MRKPFQVGEQVFCSFLTPGTPEFARTVRRTVLAVHLAYDAHPGKTGCTGWLVSADGGARCPECGHTEKPIPLIDSGYFTAAPDAGKRHKLPEVA